MDRSSNVVVNKERVNAASQKDSNGNRWRENDFLLTAALLVRKWTTQPVLASLLQSIFTFIARQQTLVAVVIMREQYKERDRQGGGWS